MADQDILQQALEVEAFIASCQVDGAVCPTWSRVPGGGPSRHTLYHGSAGVVLFYLEIHLLYLDERSDVDCVISRKYKRKD